MTQQQLNILINAKDQASEVMAQVSKSVKAVDQANKNLASNIKGNLQGAFDKMISALKTVATVAAVTVAGLTAYGANLAVSYEQQLSAIRALTGGTSSQMKSVSDLAIDLGNKTKYSALQAAQGAEELLKAGVSLEKVMGGALAGALDLAAAGNIGVAEAAEIASTALNAFSKDSLSVSQAADILAGAANASATDVGELRFALQMSSAVASGVGVTFKDTSTALALFAQNGLKGSDAGTSLKTMLMNLQPQTKDQGVLWRKLNLQFYDSQGRMKNLAGIATEMKTKFAGLTDQQRILAMETAFGTDAIRAANILFKEGAEGAATMAAEMSKFTAADVAKEKTNNLAGALERFKGTIDTKLIDAFTVPLPRVSDLLDQFNDTIQNIDVKQLTDNILDLIDRLILLAKWVETNKNTIIVVIAGIAGAFTGLGLALLYFNIMTTAASLGITGGLIPALFGVAVAGWAAIAPFLPFIIVGGLLVAAIALIVLNWDFLVAAFNNGLSLISGALESTTKSVSKFGEDVAKQFSGMWNTITTWVSGVVEQVVNMFNIVVGTIANIAQQIWNFIFPVVDLFRYLFQVLWFFFALGLKTIFDFAWGVISWFWSQLQIAAGIIYQIFITPLINAFNSIVEGIKTAIGIAWGIILFFVGVLQAAWGYIYGSFVKPAIGGFNAVKDGIVSALTTAWHFVADIGKKMADSFNAAFSIIGGTISGVIRGAINGAIGVVNSGIRGINDLIGKIPELPGISKPGKLPEIPRFENGGVIGGSSRVGDKLMIRANSGEVVLNERQQKNLLSSGAVSVNINIDKFVSLGTEKDKRSFVSSIGDAIVVELNKKGVLV